MEKLEHKLLRELLRASSSPISVIFDSIIHAVYDSIPSKLVSLWKINNEQNSLSLLARHGYTTKKIDPNDYVHELNDSLIGFCLDSKDLNKTDYYEIPDIKQIPYWNKHKGKERAKSLGLKRLILIPIPNHDKNDNTVYGVLNIYIPDDLNFMKSWVDIIKEHISITISRYHLLSQERLTNNIIKIYESRGSKDLSSVLYPIINGVLKNFVRYEGCSIFIWDPFYNRLALAQTTGLIGKPRKADVYYWIGEGLTGHVIETKKHIILRNISKIDDIKLAGAHSEKWQETVNHKAQSFLVLPIMSPSRKDTILGVIRFVNKLNNIEDVVDLFDDNDISIIRHACNMIALYMEYEQSERIRTAFAMQMAHEMNTPSFSIQGTADRLIRNWKDEAFRQRSMTKYLKDIFDQAGLQLTLTRTVEYIWKGTSGSPRSKVYQVDKTDVFDVILSSKRLIIPIARGERIHFDNIVIQGDFPTIYFDRYAMEQVFFNLLTNAIKYRDRTDRNSFHVTIEGNRASYIDIPRYATQTSLQKQGNANPTIRKNGYLITIQDSGEGIDKDDIEKIFLLGYRKKGIEERQVRGLGMGLYVVKKILIDFGCYIWISNTKSPTKFNIFFPQTLRDDNFTQSVKWGQSDYEV